MKHFYFYIILAMVLCLTLTTCKHEPPPEPTTPCSCGEVNTIEELMEWAYFKEGTYWIYEEETTGERDTFTVLTSNDYISNPSTEPYEFFGYTTHRSSDDYTYWFWFNEGWTSACGGQKGNCCSCRMLWCDKSKPGSADGEDPIFRFPTFVGNYAYIKWGGGDYGKITVKSYYDSLVIDSHTFFSVTTQNVDNSVLDQSSLNSDYFKTTYFFAKSIGIVRKEISETSEVWNLIEYQTFQ